MSDVFNEMAQDAAEIPSNATLSQVADLAEQLSVADEEIEKLEELLKAKKTAYNEIAERKLPEAMAGVGIKKFELTDGTLINVKPYYMAKIDDENRDRAHSWLESHGHADLIKHQIAVSLGKGEDAMAKAVTTALQTIGVSYTDKEAVHWQTLVAFVRESVENGRELDLDLFRVQIGQVAKIKRPK